MTLVTVSEQVETVADLLERLGDVPLWRIRMRPAPGTATEEDLLHAESRYHRLFELVEGTLVEKGMGFAESLLAVFLSIVLDAHVRPHHLGLISGADGFLRLTTGLVRVPDVAFISWDRMPGRRRPTAPIPNLAPDLAIEVLSVSNTPREMARKLQDYFTAGVSLVWFIDPRARTARVFTSPEQWTDLGETEVLDGGSVLPGFALPLRDLFGELDRQG